MHHRLACITIITVGVLATGVGAQGMRDVEIKTTKVVDGIYMLEGRGGNIGLCTGDDGAFLIDDQFAPLTGKITEAIGTVTDHRVHFLLNTHYHGDHTGGNENFGSTGTVIVAHDNVRARLKAGGGRTPPAAPDALPVVTFSDDVTFHWNGRTIHGFHVESAHTDGDTIVHFKDANVIHMGDVFFNGMYPYIDLDAGGSVDGMLAAIEAVLALANESTRIIPGHGPLATRADLSTTRDMLRGNRDRVAALIAAGKDRDAVIAAKPTASTDEEWGGGFIPPDRFAGTVYDSLVP